MTKSGVRRSQLRLQIENFFTVYKQLIDSKIKLSGCERRKNG